MKNKKEPLNATLIKKQSADSLERIIFCRHGRTTLDDSNSLSPSAVLEAVELGKKIATFCKPEELMVLSSPLDLAFKTTEAMVSPEFFSGVEIQLLDVLKAYDDSGEKDALVFIDKVTTLQKVCSRNIKVLVCVTHEPFFDLGIMGIICRAFFGQEIHVAEKGAGFAPSPGGYRILERNGSYHCTL